MGPLNSAGSGGNWPTPVMEPQAARLRASSWEEPSRCMAPMEPVGEDGEADEGGALLVERRASLFGDEREPGDVDLAEDLAEIGVEVDAHGVGEDIDASVEALVLDGDAVAVVATAGAGAGGVAGGLLNGLTGGLGGLGEVGLGGGGARGVNGGLLGGLGTRRGGDRLAGAAAPEAGAVARQAGAQRAAERW